MAVNINVSAKDWQATAAEFAGENMRLRAALQAAGRELTRLASRVNGEAAEEETGPAPDEDPDDNNPNDDEGKE